MPKLINYVNIYLHKSKLHKTKTNWQLHNGCNKTVFTFVIYLHQTTLIFKQLGRY